MLTEQIFHLICVKDQHRREREERLQDDNYFADRLDDVRVFFDRFNGRVDFTGKDILDYGCGHGAACFYIAEHGARSAVGIDIDEERIAFAQTQLTTTYSTFFQNR